MGGNTHRTDRGDASQTETARQLLEECNFVISSPSSAGAVARCAVAWKSDHLQPLARTSSYVRARFRGQSDRRQRRPRLPRRQHRRCLNQPAVSQGVWRAGLRGCQAHNGSEIVICRNDVTEVPCSQTRSDSPNRRFAQLGRHQHFPDQAPVWVDACNRRPHRSFERSFTVAFC